ncbi:PfkB family carbohydrate kinase [Micromonospora coerulea]|uniref:PfkB family carbohydrate kinase n=1 Tax=Micromonospora coerulea TaxID=47856 RepID=A0ABP8S7E7_9ACTN
MAGLDAIVVGQVARDLVLLVDEVPDASRAASVRCRRELLGGKGANQAVGLAQLGARVGLLGVVGQDEVGDRLLGRARSDGIDVAPVVRREGAPSALIVDVVDAGGRWRYLQDIGEEMLLTEADVAGAEEVVRAARAVLVQLQQPLPAALAAARCGRAADRLVVLDGAPDDLDGAAELFALADVLRADAQEAGLLVGDPPKDADAGLRAGRELRGRGPSLVAVEVAGEGNAFVWPDGEVFVPLSETPMVDSTGAGDAFVAALTVGLLRGDPPERTARYAVAAAGATVGHPGGRPALTAEAIEEQLVRIPSD